MIKDQDEKLKENINTVKYKIAEAASKSSKNNKEVLLVAATKNVSADIINKAAELGITHIGENKVQEFIGKYDSYDKRLSCQFIGHLQSNKIKFLIDRVSLIQSIDSAELAAQISALSVKNNTVTNALLQVNIGEEHSKSGLLPKCLYEAVKSCSELPGIYINGLMCVHPICSLSETRDYFKKMFEIYVDITAKKIDNISMRYLSMGMSLDYHIAIEEGANIVRIGTALFGGR